MADAIVKNSGKNVLKQETGYQWSKPSDSFLKALNEIAVSNINVNKDELNENLVDVPGHGYTAMDAVCETIKKLDDEASQYALKGLHGLSMACKSRADALRAATHAHFERTIRTKQVAAAANPAGRGSSNVPDISDNPIAPFVREDIAPKGMKEIPGTNGDMITKNQVAADGGTASPIITNEMGAISKPAVPGDMGQSPKLTPTN